MKLLDKLFGPPKPDRFARLVIATMQQAGDRRQATYDPAEFRITFTEDGRDAGVSFLHNVYGEHCKVPRAERPQHLRMVVRSFLSSQKELPDEFSDARHDLLPVLRTRSYLELLRLQQEIQGGKDLNIPHHEIGEHFFAALVYDLPESMRSIGQDDLDEWGVTYYEAMEAALQNLAERDFTFAQIGDGLYASMTGDNYDASRVLLLDLVRKLEVNGEPIAVVPNRDTLLITGSEDETGLAILAELAEKALDEPRPMNAVPMRLEGDEWVLWMPGPEHPLFEKFRFLEVKSMHGEYEDQKQLLDALHEKRDIDIFIATYTAVQSPDGQIVNYCVWSDGVDALLPKTQKVMFLRRAKDLVAEADWDRVRQVVGHLMTPVEDLYPARFRVTSFPSDEELRTIRGESL